MEIGGTKTRDSMPLEYIAVQNIVRETPDRLKNLDTESENVCIYVVYVAVFWLLV